MKRFLISLTACTLVVAALSVSGPQTPAAAPRLNAWKVLGPGGGGAQYIPTISPHTPKTAIVGCDMTGTYLSQDGGETWRMFNLRGRSRFVLFDPVDPKTIYAGGTGLWRSTDAGKTWRLVFPAPSSIARIPMSDDHAGERLLDAQGRQRGVAALAVDPADSKTLFAAIGEGRGGPSTLEMSADWGKSWTKQTDLPGPAQKLYLDPASPRNNRTLYAIGFNFILVREGGTWDKRELPAGVLAITDASAGFPKGGEKPVIYILSGGGRRAPSSLFVSRDGARSWEKSELAPDAQPAPRLEAVGCSPTSPATAYLSYANLRTSEGPVFGVAKTTDSGRTWELVRKESKEIAPNVKDAYLSRQFGPGWGSNPLAIGVAPTDPNLVYTTDYGRTMRSTDGGETWQAVYSKATAQGTFMTTGIDVTTCYGVHWDPFDSKRMFISYTDIGLFRSEDGGTSWVGATNGVPPRWVNTTYWVEFDPQVKGRMWGVMSGIHDLPRPKMWRSMSFSRYNGGVAISDDGGKSWRVASESLPPTAATHILLDPKSPVNARVLYVTGFGRGVFKSEDSGKSWTLKNKGIAGESPMAWRLSRDRNGAIYLVVARRTEDGSIGNDGDGALYRSTDNAESWQKLTLPEGVNGPNGLSIDPNDPNRLYLATWRRSTSEDDGMGGVWISTDAGKSWRRTLAKDQHVYDVTIDPKDPKVLYACGFSSSAWRSADRGESWKRIKGYNFKWGHRVISDPQNPKMVYITTFGGSLWYGPAEGDPKAAEDIATPELMPGR